jgi:hypothetical protein
MKYGQLLSAIKSKLILHSLHKQRINQNIQTKATDLWNHEMK